jgi:hypothetical protein
VFARSFNAILIFAQVDTVQIGLEDSLVAVAVTDPVAERDLLDLSPSGVVVPVEVDQLRELLGNRAGPCASDR